MKRRTGLIALLTAEGISSIGSKMSFLAIPWLVLVTTGSPTKMGLVGLFQTLPYVLSGIFATPLVDRLGIRRVAILNDVLSGLLVGGIALFARLDFTILLGLVAVIGSVQGVGDRAKRVLLQPAAEAAGTPMPRVVTIVAGMQRINTTAGVAAGGFLIAWLGPSGAIWIDAASHFICAAIVGLLVRVKMEAHESQAKEPYLTALKGGYHFLRKDRLLTSIMRMMFMTNLFNQASGAVLIPLWVMREFNSPVALGWVTGTFALGGILGNLALIGLVTKLPRYPTFIAGYFIGGAPRFLVLGLTDNLAVILAVTFIAGISMASVNPAYGALLYERVPKPLQARVFGLSSAVTFGGIPLGGLVGAWFVEGAGLTGALLLAGTVYFCATLSPVIGYRVWKQMDANPKPLPDGIASLGTLAQRYLPLGITGLHHRPVAVTVVYEEREWSVSFKGARKPLSSAQVLQAVKQLDVPEVYEVVEQIHCAEVARLKDRAVWLRDQIMLLEGVAATPRRATQWRMPAPVPRAVSPFFGLRPAFPDGDGFGEYQK